MIQDILAAIFLSGCLFSSIWMINKAFVEREAKKVRIRAGERATRGIEWGFGYQLMLGIVALSLSTAGVIGLISDLTRTLAAR